MQITLTKEQVKEAFEELRFMGADNCYRYDKDSKKKTEEVEALKLHLGSMKLGNVFCKHFLEKNAKYFWRMLHLQIGESCKASAGSYSASYIAIADHI